MSWSNDETLKFIDLYKKEPTIWNPQNEYYKDRTKIQEAWNRIENAMQIPVTELKRKKETLMASYRLHNKKISQSIQAGEDEVYKPIWVFYEDMQSFLKEVYMPASSDDSNSKSLRQELDDTEKFDQSDRGKKIRVLKPNARQLHRSSDVPRELQEVSKEMTNAFNTLNQALLYAKRPRAPCPKEDDCDLYGRLLAKRLRQFSESERQEIMYELDGLLLSRCQGRNETSINSDLSDS